MISVLTLFFASMKDEILEVAGKIYKAGMSLLVIDTENKFVSTGFAKEIARVAQGLLAKVSIESLVNLCLLFCDLCLTNTLCPRKILLLAKCFRCCYIRDNKECLIGFKELLILYSQPFFPLVSQELVAIVEIN